MRCTRGSLRIVSGGALRAACAALMKEDKQHHRSLAWACALGPGAVADLGPLLQAAEKDAKKKK